MALDNILSGNQTIILKRLFLLRLFLLTAVVIAVLVIKHTFHAELDLYVIFSLLLFAVFFSCITFYWYQRRGFVGNRDLLFQLIFDALFLAILVYFSGRSANPFIYYWLVLVAIGATIFSQKIAGIFTAFTILLYTSMLALDVGAHLQHMSTDFRLHLVGMWINFCGSAIIVTLFISRLASALRNRQELLSLAREETLKNEQLVGIGTLAASTVHSLGTPLSTITMMLEEISDTNKNQELSDAVQLMQSQILRCKATMQKLSALTDKKNTIEQAKLVSESFKEIEEHYRVIGSDPMPMFILEFPNKELKIPHNILLHHALINLIDNAIRAANSLVNVKVASENSQLKILIEDDGQGLPQDVFNYWGKGQIPNSKEGLGIGVLLANSTIEKLGGQIKLQAPQNEKRTRIEVTLPVVSD